MHAALGEVGVPLWAAERVERFTAPLFPLVRAGPGSPASAGKGEKDRNGMAGADTRGVGRVVSVTGRGKSKSKKEWVISSGIAEGAEDVAAKFQEFYADLEEAVRGRLGEHERGYRRGRGLYLQRREANGVESRRGNDSASGEEIEEKGELEAGEDEVAGEERREKRVREVMDAVERVVCSLFYDRCVQVSLVVFRGWSHNSWMIKSYICTLYVVHFVVITIIHANVLATDYFSRQVQTMPPTMRRSRAV